jgi:hypothetical protein
VKTSLLTQSLARCAVFYVVGLTPGLAQEPASEAPRDAGLPPQLVANKCYTKPNSSPANVPVQSLTQIRTNNDIDRLRADLIKQIWPDGYPTGKKTVTASSATSGKDDPSASGLYVKAFAGDRNSHLRAEQRLTIDVGDGFASVVYVWTPRTTHNRLFLVHDGHTDSMVNATNYATANGLLELGFTVVWLQMPLYGDNLSASSPAAPFPANCRAGCDRHAAIFAAFAKTGSPFRYFLEPIVVSLNYVLSQGNYRDVTMMGASGGGWATLLAAAIDTRITYSASIAGSLPLNLRTGPCGKPSVGDAEQRNQPGNLYTRITYPDLYVMAANGSQPDGSPRKHLQINNQFDTCCFFELLISRIRTPRQIYC